MPQVRMRKSALLAGVSAFMLAVVPARAGASSAYAAFGSNNITEAGSTSYYGISPNGNYIVGHFASSIYPILWTTSSGQVTGATTLSTTGSTTGAGEGYSISDTGVVVGQLDYDSSNSIDGEAVYWANASATPTKFLTTAQASNSAAYAISQNGSYIVGEYTPPSTSSYTTQAYIYKISGNAFTSLPLSNSAHGSSASGVTNDGSVVVGVEGTQNGSDSYTTGSTSAVYWYNGGAGTTYAEHTLASGGVAMAVTPDGTTIVGYHGADPNIATKWSGTPSGGYTALSLGTLSGGTASYAYGVNSDGSVVVGASNASDSLTHGFRWTSASGMQTIEQWLKSTGVNVNLGKDYVASATGVSGDGNIVIGYTRTNSSSSSSSGSGSTAVASGGHGLVTLADLSGSLSGTTVAPTNLSQLGDLVMHGAHGHPLLRLAPEDHGTVWVDGDIGGHASHASATYSDVAEVGGGYRIAQDMQINLSVGQIFSGEKSYDNGEFHQRMTYVLPEFIGNFDGTPFWGTLSLQYANGPIKLQRGYINAGNQDYSSGTPNGTLLNTRGRVDWKDAVTWDDATFTPYIDHEHAETWIASYTETNGGFPATWGARHQTDDVSRIGVDAMQPLGEVNEGLKLYGTVEQNRHWQNKGTGASGTVIGLSTFSLPGEAVPQDTTRFSIGFTQDVEGGGQFSLFGNAQTTGTLPQYWAAFGYQYAF